MWGAAATTRTAAAFRRIAAEAARAMLALAAEWGMRTAIAVVVPENAGSRRLVAKLGFEPDGSVVRRGVDLLRFRRAL